MESDDDSQQLTRRAKLWILLGVGVPTWGIAIAAMIIFTGRISN